MSWFYNYVNYGSERAFAPDNNEKSPLLDEDDEEEEGDDGGEGKSKPVDDETTI